MPQKVLLVSPMQAHEGIVVKVLDLGRPSRRMSVLEMTDTARDFVASSLFSLSSARRLRARASRRCLTASAADYARRLGKRGRASNRCSGMSPSRVEYASREWMREWMSNVGSWPDRPRLYTTSRAPRLQACTAEACARRGRRSLPR